MRQDVTIVVCVVTFLGAFIGTHSCPLVVVAVDAVVEGFQGI
jgi:hypothetical protein